MQFQNIGPPHKTTEAGMLCWSQLKERNSVVWNRKPPTEEKVVLSTKESYSTVKCSRPRVYTSSWRQRRDGSEHRSKPNVIKIHVDATIDKYGFSCGVEIMWKKNLAGAVVSLKILSPEARGFKKASSRVRLNIWSVSIVKTDCLNVEITCSTQMVLSFGLVKIYKWLQVFL